MLSNSKEKDNKILQEWTWITFVFSAEDPCINTFVAAAQRTKKLPFLTFPGSTTYGYLSYPHSTLSKVGLYKVARPRMYAFLSMLLYDWLVVSWHLSFNLFTKSQSKSSCSRFIWLVDAGLAPRWLQMVSSIALWDRSSVVKDTILPVIK